MPRLSKAEKYMREFWWGKPKSEPRDVGDALISTAKQIRIVNQRRIDKMREHTGMYRNRDCSGFMPGDVSQDHNLDEPFTYNVTKSCTDTTLSPTFRRSARKRTFRNAPGAWKSCVSESFKTGRVTRPHALR